jgi:hypothetical protein
MDTANGKIFRSPARPNRFLSGTRSYPIHPIHPIYPGPKLRSGSSPSAFIPFIRG